MGIAVVWSDGIGYESADVDAVSEESVSRPAPEYKFASGEPAIREFLTIRASSGGCRAPANL